MTLRQEITPDTVGDFAPSIRSFFFFAAAIASAALPGARPSPRRHAEAGDHKSNR